MNDPKTFIDVYENEARLASYLGYDDIADLRRFVISRYFLLYFTRYNRKWSTNLRKAGALEKVRNHYLEGSGEDFPDGNVCLVIDIHKFDYDVEYPSLARKMKQNKYLAHILILMVKHYKQPTKLTVVSKRFQDECVAELKATTQHCQNVPEMDGRTMKYSILRTGFEKSDLEPFNRAWNLLRYFSQCVNNEHIWKNNFGHTYWEVGRIIDTVYIPTWMQTQPPARTEASQPQANVRNDLPRIPIRVYWKKEGGDPTEREALKTHLKRSQHAPPSQIFEAVGNPLVHDQKQFRDTVRQQLRCEKLRLQLSWLQMTIPTADQETDDNKEDLTFDLMDCDWNIVRECLEASFQRSSENRMLRVDVRLRLLNVGEEKLFET